MLERTVEIVVQAPLERVWQLWADFENLPKWMAYVRAVKVDAARPDYSQWQFGTELLTVEWTAKVTRRIPLRLVAWESVAGLANRGQVEFFPTDLGCRVRLSFGVADPGGIVGAVLLPIGLGRWLDENLAQDLARFGQLVEATS